MQAEDFRYIIQGQTIGSLQYGQVLQHCSAIPDTGQKGYFDLQPDAIQVNSASFTIKNGNGIANLFVTQTTDRLVLSCDCPPQKQKLCNHQVQALLNIMERPYLRIFFDDQLRKTRLQEAAKSFGLEQEPHLDDFFQLVYTQKAYNIIPLHSGLIALDETGRQQLETGLLPGKDTPPPSALYEHLDKAVVLSKHKYLGHFQVQLLLKPEGNSKATPAPVDATDMLWQLNSADEAKFYSSIIRFQKNYDTADTVSDIAALQWLVKNPGGFPFFYHDTAINEKLTTANLQLIQLASFPAAIELSINRKGQFYEITACAIVNEQEYTLKSLPLRLNYFIHLNSIFYLIDDADLLRIIQYFKSTNERLLIHVSKFPEFQRDIIARLESKVKIKYAYLRPAEEAKPKDAEIIPPQKQLIYLSDGDQFVCITPVMQYGETEVAVLSRKTLYTNDANGNPIVIERDNEAELKLTTAVLKQHPFFYEQLHNTESFFLHKKYFLHEEWFLNAFEEWHEKDITVLGFDTIKNNRFNPHKVSVTVQVSSGINWFETAIDVRFGKQKASLAQLQKSVRHKNRFVQLSDGSLGILPQEWLLKFAGWFAAGTVEQEVVKTPRQSFMDITNLYEQHQLAMGVEEAIADYRQRIESFEKINAVEAPFELQTDLRPYQQQGLAWLNFLDDFSFGGCLADDMGLGKTIQVIAFILLLRKKHIHNTNLIIVPASLVFNWQQEIARFAPTIHTLVLHGDSRIKAIQDFDQYEVILTTYGRLLGDIRLLKKYVFNYVILDESQAIKNPSSQRYQAACLLQSRNRLVLTGTPIENNSFDLYGQLSFACPGLLGGKQYFKDVYLNPVDKFDDTKRLKELQQKIAPFILRRTKAEVAKELPDKTEMTIYCEMGEEQRKIYDTAEEEIRNYLTHIPGDDTKKDPIYVLKSITRLRQICNSPALLKDEEYYGNHSAKLDALMEQLENNTAGQKLLIFSQFVGMLDLVKKELIQRNIPFEYLTGQTRNREEKVASFQNNPDVKIFLISLKAGGTGLNLTEASYVYLLEPWWNPAVENQAIDRTHRIGQQKNVVAIRLICPNTIEEKIIKLQQSKNELASGLIKSDTALLQSLTITELQSLLQ